MFVDLFYLIHSSIMLYFQEKLLLEPYTSSRNVAYVILAPDNDTTIANVKMYFKELSAIYEVSWMKQVLVEWFYNTYIEDITWLCWR